MGEVGAELWLHWRRRACASSRRPHARSARRSRRRFTNVWRIHTAVRQTLDVEPSPRLRCWSRRWNAS